VTASEPDRGVIPKGDEPQTKPFTPILFSRLLLRSSLIERMACAGDCQLFLEYVYYVRSFSTPNCICRVVREAPCRPLHKMLLGILAAAGIGTGSRYRSVLAQRAFCTRYQSVQASTGPVPAVSCRPLPGDFPRRRGPVPEARHRPVLPPRAFWAWYRSIPAGTGPVPAVLGTARISIPTHHHL
jgi:hypothetical protein